MEKKVWGTEDYSKGSTASKSRLMGPQRLSIVALHADFDFRVQGFSLILIVPKSQST